MNIGGRAIGAVRPGHTVKTVTRLPHGNSEFEKAANRFLTFAWKSGNQTRVQGGLSQECDSLVDRRPTVVLLGRPG